MGKATTTIKQQLTTRVDHGAWFAATQFLFNRIASFYFEVIQAYQDVLELPSNEALTALEKFTHATKRNPHPVMPLSAIREGVPSYFRRAAIHAALGSAHSFSSHLKAWHTRKEKAHIQGKKFTERPPVPPRTWNKSVTLYAGMYKGRTASSLIVKVWTGSCWSWVKCRITGRELPEETNVGSPQLVRHGQHWWVHTPVERVFTTPPKIAQQITNPETKLCSVDLNLDGHIAVCTVQTSEGTIPATKFIQSGTAISGFRKQTLGRIARNRKNTVLIAEDEQDNVALWQKIRNVDEAFAHLVSRRIVDFAQEHGATILVFEHLDKLRPEKGKYSRRGNTKRAFWMKGRIYRYAKYKAWQQGIVTSRVNPRNTSRECACCHTSIIRYRPGQSEEGYTTGAPLMLCPQCQRRDNADRNASIVIGQRLISRYEKQEKPRTPLSSERERESKDSGVLISQEAEGELTPSLSLIRHGDEYGHGTAHETDVWMEMSVSPIPLQLRLPME